MIKSSFLALVVLAAAGYAEEAAIHWRVASLSGYSFLDAFSWQTQVDPTHGRVEYVSKETAQQYGLYSVSGHSVTLRADHSTVLNPSGPGRKSFRLMSNNQYKSHVAVFDIGHMPQGCGTWPAVYVLTKSMFDLDCVYREVGYDWPNNGEIDILEGVNDKVPNQSTLHTGPNCGMPHSRWMTGTSLGDNCDVYSTGNVGCPVHINNYNSFGPNFNNIGGGWYAVHRTSTYVAIYFWERGSTSVPSDVKYPGDSVETNNWGTPAAYFPNTDCDLRGHLGPMNIVINLDFCGDWAGAVYKADGCPGNCVDYVNNNPGAFSKAYFEFNSLNIYE